MYVNIFVLLGGVLVGIIGAKKFKKAGVLMHYTPVSSISNLPNGAPVAVAGVVATETPLQSPFTQKPCVYYDYVLEREAPRKRADGSVFYRWEIVSGSQPQSIPFVLQDSTGVVAVQCEGAEMKGIPYTEQFLQPGGIASLANTTPTPTALSSVLAVASVLSGNRERVKEYAIFVGSQLQVFGFSTVTENQRVITKQDTYPLILTAKTRSWLIGYQRQVAYWLIALALVLVGWGLYLMFRY